MPMQLQYIQVIKHKTKAAELTSGAFAISINAEHPCKISLKTGLFIY